MTRGVINTNFKYLRKHSHVLDTRMKYIRPLGGESGDPDKLYCRGLFGIVGNQNDVLRRDLATNRGHYIYIYIYIKKIIYKVI